MSDELSRREFDLYVGANDARVGRVEHDLDDKSDRHERDMRDIAAQREADNAKWSAMFQALAAQREADLERARRQREADQQAARSSAQHSKEWTWSQKLGAFMALVALGTLAIDVFMHR